MQEYIKKSNSLIYFEYENNIPQKVYLEGVVLLLELQHSWILMMDVAFQQWSYCSRAWQGSCGKDEKVLQQEESPQHCKHFLEKQC